jgi:2-methylcitrate dehydratase PrpD
MTAAIRADGEMYTSAPLGVNRPDGHASQPLAEELAEWVAGFSLAESPAREQLLERAKLHVLDALGVALGAASADPAFAGRLLAYVATYQSAPVATIVGSDARAAAPLAAFANGALVHGCEFDDTSHERVVHTEAFAVPPVLAIGEQLDSSGLHVAEAWCVATELALRLAAGCNHPAGLWTAGFHNSAVFGTFGACAGVAKLLRLDAATTADALSLCSSFASGTVAGWGDASGRNKSLQPGWAGLAGTHAALLASTGYSCSHRTLDSEAGLFAAHAPGGAWTRDAVTAGLGSEWKTLDIAFKLHPAGAMMQAALDVTRSLVVENGVLPDEVTGVEVVTPAQYAPVLDRFLAESYRPQSGYALSHSWPGTIACTILHGRLGLEHLAGDLYRSPELLELIDVMSVRAAEDDSLPPDEQLSIVSIETVRGTFSGNRARHLGYPAAESRKSVLEKFAANASLRLPERRVSDLATTVLELERHGARAVMENAR